MSSWNRVGWLGLGLDWVGWKKIQGRVEGREDIFEGFLLFFWGRE